MKPVTMFTLASCPYCREALGWMEDVFDEHPEYHALELTVIDEGKKPDIANRYDYWYVPTYYIGDQKVHEGAASKEIISKVFARAYGAQAGKQQVSGE